MGINAAVLAATKSSGSSSFTFLLLIVVVFVGFYFLMIRPQRRRQQRVAQQQNTVAPGARVRTTAGMYATVVAVDGDDVVLEVAPGVEVRYVKRAIMEVIAPGEEPLTEDEPYDQAEPYDEAEPFDQAETGSEAAGTDDAADIVGSAEHNVGSAEQGRTDSHENGLAKSDKDNVF